MAKAGPEVMSVAEAIKSAVNKLRELGLASFEAQAYLALIRAPDITATALCTETRIPDSKVYFALEELHKRGLIMVTEGTPRSYRAAPPKEALAKLKAQLTKDYKAKVDKLNELATALEPFYRRAERKDIELAYVIKGFENVLSKMIEILRSARREVVVFVPDVNIYERLESHFNQLSRHGVKLRLAVHPKIRKQIDPSRFEELREMTATCDNCWLTVADEKTVVSASAWETDRCHAILTQDPSFVAMSREYFESPRCCVAK